MNIPINDKYRISSDKRQWIIQESRIPKKGLLKGKVIWESKSFFPNIDYLVKHLAGQLVRTSEAETLAEALHQVENVATELVRALTPHFEIKVKK